MKKTLLVSFVAAGLCFVTAGCEQKKEAPPAPAAPAKPPAPAPAPTAAAPTAMDGGAAAAAAPSAAAPAAPGAAAPTPAAGQIGVAECDDYLKKMDACLAKVPPANKAAMEQGVKASRDAWKAAAATPQGKEGLKTACKAAADAMAQNPACK